MNTKPTQTKFEAYLLTEKRVSKNTFLSYQKDLNQFMDFIEKKNISLELITGDELKKFVHYLYGLKLSAASIAGKISTLKTFFRYLTTYFNIKIAQKSCIYPKLKTFD